MARAKKTPDTVAVELPAEATSAPTIYRAVPPLAEYIVDVEARHLDRDVYAVEVTYPDADERVYPGTYCGIRINSGPLGVRYSDGTRD
jgi:hypothetical protein